MFTSIYIVVFLLLMFSACGENSGIVNLPVIEGDSASLIINHTHVAMYDDIPQSYINIVKTMWLNVPGESHSYAYRYGAELLEASDPLFAALVYESGIPEGPTDQQLRISRATWSGSNWFYSYGEEGWFTNTEAVEDTVDHIDYANINNLALSAIGFGWCWDTTWLNGVGGTMDPEYFVRWAGASVEGPDGNLRWGLDSGDTILTGNSVNMQTYIDATETYIAHVATENYDTKVFFTTGPVDGGGNTGESGYQRYLKHNYIRDHVQNTDGRILFDYADILCWNDAGIIETRTWTDGNTVEQVFPYIHPDNMQDLAGNPDSSIGHIGAAGALRLAKAYWVMLAIMAGWEPI